MKKLLNCYFLHNVKKVYFLCFIFKKYRGKTDCPSVHAALANICSHQIGLRLPQRFAKPKRIRLSITDIVSIHY